MMYGFSSCNLNVHLSRVTLLVRNDKLMSATTKQWQHCLVLLLSKEEGQ